MPEPRKDLKPGKLALACVETKNSDATSKTLKIASGKFNKTLSFDKAANQVVQFDVQDWEEKVELELTSADNDTFRSVISIEGAYLVSS